VPLVVEEPNLEVLGSTVVALGTEANALSITIGHGGPGLHKNREWLLL
jgi:hypothetical protein